MPVGELEECAVLDARPTHVLNRVDFMTGQLAFEPHWDAFIEQKAHEPRAVSCGRVRRRPGLFPPSESRRGIPPTAGHVPDSRATPALGHVCPRKRAFPRECRDPNALPGFCRPWLNLFDSARLSIRRSFPADAVVNA